MCGSEPCRHERDYTIGDAMTSYVAASVLAGDAAIERDALRLEVALLKSEVTDFDRLAEEALAMTARVEALATWFEAQPNWNGWGIHRAIRDALKPTDQPKGTKP